jgi:hypothetical protein
VRLRVHLLACALAFCLHFEQVVGWPFLLLFVWNKKKLALDVSTNRVKAACGVSHSISVGATFFRNLFFVLTLGFRV